MLWLSVFQITTIHTHITDYDLLLVKRVLTEEVNWRKVERVAAHAALGILKDLSTDNNQQQLHWLLLVLNQ